MVPVGVGHQHAEQAAAIVATGLELLTGGLGCLIRGASEPGKARDVCRDVGTEARVDQEVALRMLHQDRGGGEVARVEERAAADRECRAGLIRTGGQLVDGHIRWWGGRGKGRGPGSGQMEACHV